MSFLLALLVAFQEPVVIHRSGDGSTSVGDVTVETRTIGEPLSKRTPAGGVTIDAKNLKKIVEQRQQLKDEWT